MEQLLSHDRPLKSYFIPILYALGGVFFASLGAFIEESSIVFGFTLGLVVIGPVIEEVLKPFGVVVLLEKGALYLRSKSHVFWLCITSGLVFSLIENLLYTYVYLLPYFKYPHLYMETLIYRYTVCILLHIFTTSIMAIGLMRQFDVVKKNKGKFALENITPYIVIAASIHGSYNFLALLLSARPQHF